MMERKVPSKGKWLAGGKPAPKDYLKLFNCEPCDRSFTKLSYYEKHKTTELHFKRISRQTCTDYNADPDYFEQVRKRRSCRVSSDLPKSNGNHRNEGKTSNCETHVHCPSCYSSVEKQRMGKHLISHFHCQKTSSTLRKVNPERKLILDNIQDIVLQSPFQCYPCKYYFTNRVQLMNHFREKHLNLGTWRRNPLRHRIGWTCSACRRRTLCSDGAEMITHLDSPGHLKMEATIGKSIPIILKEVQFHTCPDCPKRFVLGIEIAKHFQAKKHGFASKLSSKTQTLAFRQESRNKIVKNELDINSISKTQTPKLDDKRRLPKLKLLRNSKRDDKTNVMPPRSTRSSQRNNATATNPNLPQAFFHRCSECPAEFGSLSSLRKHISHSHRSNGYKCETCDYATRKRSHFTRHTATHKTDRDRKFSCGDCPASFHQLYELNHHKKLHSGKTVKCDHPGCEYLGRNQSDVKTHSVTHLHKGIWGCEEKECDYVAKSKSHLKRHTLLKHGKKSSSTMDVVPQPKYNCGECSFSTKILSNLRRHELKHTGQKPFHCPHCSYTARNIENLRTHVIKYAYHSETRLYCCRICLKDGVPLPDLFKTNVFVDFKTHVISKHEENPLSQSHMGLCVIAGIRVDDENFPNDLPLLPQKTRETTEPTELNKDPNKSNSSSAGRIMGEVLQPTFGVEFHLHEDILETKSPAGTGIISSRYATLDLASFISPSGVNYEEDTLEDVVHSIVGGEALLEFSNLEIATVVELQEIQDEFGLKLKRH